MSESVVQDALFFMAAYESAASEGKADSPGGLEYVRVLTEWIAVGRDAPVYPFICWRANIDVTSPDADLDGPAAQARLEAMRRGD